MPGWLTIGDSGWLSQHSHTASRGVWSTPIYGSHAWLVKRSLPARDVAWVTQRLVLFVPFGQGLHPLRRSAVEARPTKQYSPTAENRFAETSTPDRAIPRSVPALKFAFRAGETTPSTHAAQVTPKPRPPLPETPNELIHPQLNALIHTPVHVQCLCSLLSHHPDKSFPLISPRACPRALLLVFGPQVPLLLVYAHLLTTHLLSEIGNLYQLICSLLVTLVRQRDPSPSLPSHTCMYRAWELFPRKMGNSGLFMICHPRWGKCQWWYTQGRFQPGVRKCRHGHFTYYGSRPGAYLTKVDVRSALRLCPVRPGDWFLLGIYWEKHYYYDRVLPFGLRSAPYIFNKFADGLQWILQDTGNLPRVIRYVDDFLDIATANQAQAQHHHDLILALFRYLHVPVAPEKVEGPSTSLTFLGIELDTVHLEMRLPHDKKDEILATVHRILSSNRVNKRKLASVVGKLSFASRAIIAGRTFLRWLYDFMKATASVKPHVSLLVPATARDDLEWWSQALSMYSGKSFFPLDKWTPAPDMQLQTDASGTVRYDAYCAGEWLSMGWTPQQLRFSIEFKELFAIVIACHIWEHKWPRQRILFQCDNEAVVYCIKSGTSRSKTVMSLICSLYHVCIKHNFVVSAVHIPGVKNCIADALSRRLLQKFKTLAPTAEVQPTTPILPLLPTQDSPTE